MFAKLFILALALVCASAGVARDSRQVVYNPVAGAVPYAYSVPAISSYSTYSGVPVSTYSTYSGSPVAYSAYTAPGVPYYYGRTAVVV